MTYLPNSLQGRCILVVEDEYYLADHFQSIVESAGGLVVGPYDSVAQVLDYLAGDAVELDGASLDVTLLDGKVYPVADRLTALRIPFLFASGGARDDIPACFADAQLVRKPLSPDDLVDALLRLGH